MPVGTDGQILSSDSGETTGLKWVDQNSPLLKRVDNGVWELPKITKFGVIASVAQPTGSITAFADAGGGQITVTSVAHGRQEGTSVTISGTTNYNGTFTVSNVTDDTFEITDTWVSDDATGTWVDNNFTQMTDTAHGLSNGDEIHVMETTNHDGLWAIVNSKTNTFEIEDPYVGSDSGYWTDTNEYYADNQNGGILGTVYARRLKDTNLATTEPYFYVNDGVSVATLSFTGYVRNSVDTAERFGVVTGSTVYNIHIFGRNNYISVFAGSDVDYTQGILTYVKDAASYE